MRNYRVFTIMSFIVWVIAFSGEMIDSKKLTVALVLYLAMALWSALTIIKEENK